jgi:hypothetical protein
MTSPLAFLLSMALVAPTPLQDPEPKGGFDELADGFLAFHLYFNPVRASLAGERDYDSRLPDVSRAALRARAEAYQLWLDRLGSVDPAGSVGDAREDRVLLERAIRAELLDLVEVRRWERDPAFYLDLIASGVAILVEDTGIPLRNRMNALTSRLRQVSTVLAEARTNLRGGVPEVFVDPSLRGATRLEAFLSTDVSRAFAAVPPGPGRDDFTRALSRAAAEVAEYSNFLAREVPRGGDFRLGPDRLGWLLRYREHIDESAAEIVALIDAEIVEERARLESLGGSSDAAAGTLSGEAGRATAAARDLMTAARGLVFRSLFVTIPSDEQPRVATRSPLFAWEEPDVWGPGPLQPYDGPSTLYLIEDIASGPANTAQVGAAVLEAGFPGRFVERLYARRAPTRLRKVVRPATLRAGWSSYAAAQLVESGFGSEDLALLAAHTQRRLLALAETRAAIRMHTTTLGVEDAAAEVMRDAGVSASEGRSSAVRAAHRPLEDGILGSLQIRALREDFLAASEDDEARAQRHFHDALLASGLPPALARSLLLRELP